MTFNITMTTIGRLSRRLYVAIIKFIRTSQNQSFGFKGFSKEMYGSFNIFEGFPKIILGVLYDFFETANVHSFHAHAPSTDLAAWRRAVAD